MTGCAENYIYLELSIAKGTRRIYLLLNTSIQLESLFLFAFG